MLEDARAKLGRSAEHCAAIQSLLVNEGDRVQRLIDRAKPGDKVPLQVEEATPQRIALIASDALHNLRSALDCVVFTVGSAQGMIHPERSAFPIAVDFPNYLRAAERSLGNASAELRNFVDEWKPYRDGGDGILWGLHALNNIDKHRRMLLTGEPQVTIQGFIGVGCFASAYFLNIDAREPLGGTNLTHALGEMLARVGDIVSRAESQFSV